jgi:hypothetical protein
MPIAHAARRLPFGEHDPGPDCDGLTFNDFLVNLTPIVALLLAVFIGLSWLMFRK